MQHIGNAMNLRKVVEQGLFNDQMKNVVKGQHICTGKPQGLHVTECMKQIKESAKISIEIPLPHNIILVH